jgi:drug/metabolite transporter (DMT)-like permease
MELSLVLALASALTWGAGDFFGGLATRDAKAVSTTLVSQFVGLLGLVVVCVLGAGGSFVFVDIAWGTTAGLCAVGGLGLFYESMGRGPFGPVASITSVVSGAIPIVVGLALGEKPSLLVLVGVSVAVVAILLIAGEKRKPGEPESSRSAMVLALGAGVLFGAYFVLLSRAGSASGLWPLVAGRTAASVALGLTILVLGYGKANPAFAPKRHALRLAATAGLLDASANALYFYASRNGLLSVVAVLASMYPVSTILLARVSLRETVSHRRLAGMLVGLFAVSIIAKGGAGHTPDTTPIHAVTEVQPAPTTMKPVPGSENRSPSTVPPTSIPDQLALQEELIFAEPFAVVEDSSKLTGPIPAPLRVPSERPFQPASRIGDSVDDSKPGPVATEGPLAVSGTDAVSDTGAAGDPGAVSDTGAAGDSFFAEPLNVEPSLVEAKVLE